MGAAYSTYTSSIGGPKAEAVQHREQPLQGCEHSPRRELLDVVSTYLQTAFGYQPGRASPRGPSAAARHLGGATYYDVDHGLRPPLGRHPTQEAGCHRGHHAGLLRAVVVGADGLQVLVWQLSRRRHLPRPGHRADGIGRLTVHLQVPYASTRALEVVGTASYNARCSVGVGRQEDIFGCAKPVGLMVVAGMQFIMR